MNTEPRSLASVWARNNLVIGVLALLALMVVDGGLVLVGVLLALGVNTVSVVRSWVFLSGYRWFWWWR